MPNTLAHIGVNGLLIRSLIRKSDLFWIYFGAIIPDIPWILQRGIETLFPSVNGFDLRLFVIVQATLLFSLILSAAVAFITSSPKRTFLILALGSLLHLLLDPLQIKLANGVHLFAPFSWELLNFGLFWPESLPTYILTFSGVLFFVFNWKKLVIQKLNVRFKLAGLLFSFLLLTTYFITPFYFMPHVEETNNHFIKTLRDVNNRKGKYVELDRQIIKFNEKTNQYSVEIFDKSYIPLLGIGKTNAHKISLKGIFIDNRTIRVTEFHEHLVWFRDGASYLGLALILLSVIIKGKRTSNLNN